MKCSNDSISRVFFCSLAIVDREADFGTTSFLLIHCLPFVHYHLRVFFLNSVENKSQIKTHTFRQESERKKRYYKIKINFCRYFDAENK